MKNYLDLKETENGNLLISINKEGKKELRELLKKSRDYVSTWIDLLEYNICNSPFEFVHPEKIGALTDSPIIGFDITWDENGEIEESNDTKYWFFPDYMVKDEFKQLLKTGSIVFTKA